MILRKINGRKWVWFLMMAFLGMAFLCGCQAKKSAEYQIEITGTAEKPGLIGFLNYSINVYQDQASNPCGDCADQPVHLFVGADESEIAEAIAELITRADDQWEVKSVDGSQITLALRDGESIEDTGTLLAPEGVTLKGAGTVNGKKVAQESEKSEDIIVYRSGEMKIPQRIAAVYGPSYEMLVVLGVEDKIVVRADVQTDSFPWAEEVFSRITQLPKLDNVHTAVNFEQLMTYQPDLVFTFPRQNELAQLRSAGVQAVEGRTETSLNGVCDQLDSYAEALGDDAISRSNAYREYFEKTLADVEAVTQSIPMEKRKTVYYAGTDILTTYGNQSDLIEVITAAGGIPVMADLSAGNRAQINYEQLIKWNPEYIFLDHGGMNQGKSVETIQAEVFDAKQYQPIAAVQDKNVYVVPSGVFYWDMGLQKILLVNYMAKILYPEVFQEVSMEEELMEFYRMFYQYELTWEQASKILSRQAP